VNEFISRVLVGLMPVVMFLFALVYLDSYKLIPLRRIVVTIVLGGVVAGASYLINVALLSMVSIDQVAYSRYLAPLVEELGKALFLVYMIRANRIGFLVDAAIYGFAIGTGFALVENVYYLNILGDVPFAVWIVRGAGTAIMHGGATAIFGILAKTFSERSGASRLTSYLPGFAVAWLVHSVFNHFFLSPVLSTLGVLIVLPPRVDQLR
jgi:RsiW-degrading membrane proteinase PrsW (M82 family)